MQTAAAVIDYNRPHNSLRTHFQSHLMSTHDLRRRTFLKQSAAACATLAAGIAPGFAQSNKDGDERYRIGVCDWMILKRQRLGAFPLAKEIGVDGVEVDMGSLGSRDTFESQLGDAAGRKPFIDAAKENNLEICSLAMSGFYAQSFAERPTYDRMVGDTIVAARSLGVKVAFLPLGVQGDLVKHPELRPAIVDRLQHLAPQAEAAGVVLGLETALDAAGERQLLDDIGSPAVQIYFNFANPLQAGRNLLAELQVLTAEHICQIHATDEDGVWLENNDRIDMPAVKQSLDEMGWRGWLVLERSRDASDARNVRRNFGANARYLKSIFQAG
jgi:L-ribulose-5-phosphate 3-epimerase